MRVAAAFGVLVLAGLAWLFLKLAIDGYKRQREGEVHQMQPPFTAVIMFFFTVIMVIILLIYALGLEDSFAFMQEPTQNVVRQY